MDFVYGLNTKAFCLKDTLILVQLINIKVIKRKHNQLTIIYCTSGGTTELTLSGSFLAMGVR